jgi:carbamoyl-phosphate synthase large subunit
VWPDVLITAGSRRVPLVDAFRRSLAEVRPGGRVIVTDVNALSPTVYTAHRAYRVPLATEPGYVDAILEIAVGERVGLVVPTIDDELPILASAVSRFAAHGIRIAVSSPRTTAICNDKHATCATLRRHGIAAAETWLPDEVPADAPMPLFVKPRGGRGGVGAFPVRSRRELAFFLDYVADPIVQEHLSGPEFTIDVLCDFSGKALSIVPRRRDHIRAGVIDRGCTVNDRTLIALAASCVRVLDFAGPINIQCRVANGRPTVFEINARFSGGIPLTIAAGADFPRMLLALAAGHPVPPSIGRFQDRLWMTSYESSIMLAEDAIQLEAYRPDRSVEGAA